MLGSANDISLGDVSSLVQKHETGNARVVVIGVPWCQHCTSMIENIRNINMPQSVGFAFVKDVENEKSSAVKDAVEKYVNGYPTVLIMRDRGLGQYTGPRDLRTLQKLAGHLHTCSP